MFTTSNNAVEQRNPPIVNVLDANFSEFHHKHVLASVVSIIAHHLSTRDTIARDSLIHSSSNITGFPFSSQPKNHLLLLNHDIWELCKLHDVMIGP